MPELLSLSLSCLVHKNRQMATHNAAFAGGSRRFCQHLWVTRVSIIHTVLLFQSNLWPTFQEQAPFSCTMCGCLQARRMEISLWNICSVFSENLRSRQTLTATELPCQMPLYTVPKAPLPCSHQTLGLLLTHNRSSRCHGMLRMPCFGYYSVAKRRHSCSLQGGVVKVQCQGAQRRLRTLTNRYKQLFLVAASSDTKRASSV